MITAFDLEKHDPSGMHKVYDRWPEIALEAYKPDYDSLAFDGIDHIVFIGMGGSGAIGDLFSSMLSKNNIHVTLIKGYLLPQTLNKNTLVIATSASGNTVETLTALESAAKLGCTLVVFSSGGRIEEFCKKNRINFQKIETVHSPRASLVRYVYYMLRILGSVLPITKNEIIESIEELKNIRNKISSHNLSETNPSLELASWISDISLIYYPHGLQSAAIRFKSSLQENAKSHAMIEDVIEACHNGIVAWERTSPVQPILIRGQDDYAKTKERWEIVKKYFTENRIDFREIQSPDGHILTKIISLIYLLDYATIYKAVLNRIDPSPVNSIDYIKRNI